MGATQILIAIAGIILYIGWYRFSRRCPNCHHWNSLKKKDRVFAGSSTEYRWETEKSINKDKRGNEIGTSEVKRKVPYNIDHYKVTYHCKCGYELSKTVRSRELFFKDAWAIFLLFIILSFAIFDSNRNKILNSNTNQNNIADTLSNYSKTNVTKVNDFSPKKSSDEDAKSKNSDLSSKASTKGDAESGNSASQPKELEIESPNVKPNNAQVKRPQTVITAESPEYLKRELAFEMLKRGKEVDEISDSTFLSKIQIRKLRRNIEKK